MWFESNGEKGLSKCKQYKESMDVLNHKLSEAGF